jgi:hypothetical protein
MDDVLHPLYPTLTIAVADFLKSSPDYRIFCIIDRESLVASCKFLICRSNAADLYKALLVDTFPTNILKQRVNYFESEALMMTPLISATAPS